ncbi:hypothetical protein K501DRAFT_266100 [Backusella circina FSU 941]|nr:hypothetical protein K501DRAFT_266100 [Backusella circina FSU 941]
MSKNPNASVTSKTRIITIRIITTSFQFLITTVIYRILSESKLIFAYLKTEKTVTAEFSDYLKELLDKNTPLKSVLVHCDICGTTLTRNKEVCLSLFMFRCPLGLILEAFYVDPDMNVKETAGTVLYIYFEFYFVYVELAHMYIFNSIYGNTTYIYQNLN